MKRNLIVTGACVAALVAAVLVSAALRPHPMAPAHAHQKFGSANHTLFSLLDAKMVTATIAARPALATDGVDITTWRTSSTFTGAMAAVFIAGSTTATVTSPSGGSSGVELWGYRMTKWWLIAELRDGRDISVTSTTGYSQAVNVIGVYDRLAVAGTVSAGTATAQLAPIEAWQ